MELEESCGRVGGRTEGPEEDRNCTERPKEPTNLYPWGPSKSEHGLDLGPLHINSRNVAWSSFGYPNNWSGGCSWICCLLVDLFPSLGQLPCLTSVGEDVLVLQWLDVLGWVWDTDTGPRGLTLLRGEGEREWEDLCEGILGREGVYIGK